MRSFRTLTAKTTHDRRRLASGPLGSSVAAMLTTGLVVKLTAKPEMAEEVASFLTGALELANQEAGTPVWMTLRNDPTTFWIVDAFPGDAERQAHLDGPIAAALMENADRLLASPPEILPADVLAAK